jgi:hypothetical protein
VPFATILEVAAYLGEEVNDAQAQLAVDLVSDLVRDYCGWRVDRAVDTFTVSGTWGRALLLPTLHLNDVTTVTVAGVEVDEADYSWDAAGVLYRAEGWASTVRGITVTADHGYTPVPGAVRVVTLQAAARALTNPAGMRSLAANGIVEAYGYVDGLTLTPAERAVLDRYRVAQ